MVRKQACDGKQELTPKQAAFCREYLVDFNATQAAIRAGYSKKTANEQAARALVKVSIQDEVRRLTNERTKRVEVNSDFVIRMLVENVHRSMQAIAVLDSEGKSLGQYRYNGAVANKALELLGRHLGMFVQLTDNKTRNRTAEPCGNCATPTISPDRRTAF